MVQRAAHRIADEQAIGQCAMIVSAECSNSKKICAASRQDYVFTIELAGNHSTIWNVLDWKTIFKIRFLSVCLFWHRITFPRSRLQPLVRPLLSTQSFRENAALRQASHEQHELPPAATRYQPVWPDLRSRKAL